MIWDADRSKVHPALADSVDKIPGSFAAVQGFRSPTVQNNLWAEGRDSAGNIVDPKAVVTYAKGFDSAHTVTSPLGTLGGAPDAYAVDIARVDEHGNRVYDYKTHPDWQAMRDYVDKSPDLHGGWHFPDPDNDHIQSVDWYKIKQQLKDMGAW